MQTYGPEEEAFKLLVVGDCGTGKTSLVRRFVHNVYHHTTKATIGVDFALKVMEVSGRQLTTTIWDIAGQEQFGTMTRVYYGGAVGALVVFDVSRPSTFESAAHWKKDIDDKVHLPDESPIPCVLVANKADLNKNTINEAQMNAFCEEHNFIGWVETSCKEGWNIKEPFERLVKRVFENAYPSKKEETEGTIRIGDDKKRKYFWQRCCS